MSTIEENSTLFKDIKEKFDVIFENAPDNLIIVSKEGKIISINKKLEKFLGYKRKDLIGKKFTKTKVISNKSIGLVSKKFRWRIAGNKIKPYELEFVRKNGEKIFGEVNASLIKENGKIIGSIGFIRDITERKKSEEELKQNEEKYKILYDSSTDAIMTLFPPDWKFTGGNIATVNMFGMKNEKEFTSMGPWSLSPKYQPDGELSAIKAKRMIEIAMKKGSNFFEWTHAKINGKAFPATVLLTRIEMGGREGLQATVRDITNQKKVEEELKQNEEKFRTLFDNVNDGILCADAVTTKFYFGNKAMANMLGYIQEELKNLRIPSIHPKKNLPYILETFKKMSMNQTNFLNNIPVKRRNGSIFYADISSSTITLNNRLYVVGIFRDITERKKSEEELKKTRDELQKKVEELERFNRIAIGRELRMIELKKKLNELKK